jgi:hypothetical protein
MVTIWGTKKWEILAAIGVILVLGVGIYFIAADLLRGSEIWWYDLAMPLFAFSGVGLLLLVRTAKKTLTNIAKYGINPSSVKQYDEAYHVEETSEQKADLLDDEPVFNK